MGVCVERFPQTFLGFTLLGSPWPPGPRRSGTAYTTGTTRRRWRSPGPPGGPSSHVGDVLLAARSLCDFVLVDSPPLLMTSDAADLARHADAVLLVIRAGHTSIGAAARAAERLQRFDIPVLGAVLHAGRRRLAGLLAGAPG